MYGGWSGTASLVGLVGHKGRFRRHFVRVTPTSPLLLCLRRPKTGSEWTLPKCPCPGPLSMSWSLSPPNLCHSNLLHHLSSPPFSSSSLLRLETHVYEANQQLNMATLTLLKATQYWPSKRSQCCFVMVLLPPASKWWCMGAPVINVVPDVPQTAPATTCPSSSNKTEFPHCTLVQLYLRRTSVYSYPTSPSSDCNHDSKTKRSASNP